jgi:GxxExxY protein
VDEPTMARDLNHQGHQEHQDAQPEQEIPKETDRVASLIVDCGLCVHRALGPGLLESAYEECLAYEFTKRNIAFQKQLPMPISYDGKVLDVGYRLDFLVERCVIVEAKAVEALIELHQAQILTYMKLSNCRVGLLMNFNVRMFKDGVRRFAL